MAFDQISDVVGLVTDFRASVVFSHAMADLLKLVLEALLCNVVELPA